MDDLDRELKQVQLARERLALEKELRQFDTKARTIGSLKKCIAYTGAAVGEFVEGGGRFLSRRLWSIAFAVAIGVLGFGIYKGVENHHQAEVERNTAAYLAADKYSIEMCDLANPKNQNSCVFGSSADAYMACAAKHYSDCRENARARFTNQGLIVLDSANLLTREQSAEINALISNHSRSGFGHIRLIVIQQLPENTSIEDYADVLLRDDLATAEGRVDLVLFIVALADRTLRIEIATAVQPFLSDEFSKHVIDNHIVPQFKQDNYFIGIKDGLNALISKLKDQDRELEKSNE